jgi:hypothetical protein
MIFQHLLFVCFFVAINFNGNNLEHYLLITTNDNGRMLFWLPAATIFIVNPSCLVFYGLTHPVMSNTSKTMKLGPSSEATRSVQVGNCTRTISVGSIMFRRNLALGIPMSSSAYFG